MSISKTNRHLHRPHKTSPGFLSTACMSVSASSSNPFARVLQFYDLYIRSKLVPSDLDKIARKYGANPAKLVADLQQKYSYPIPDSVNVQQVARICQQYNVSSVFTRLAGVENVEYDSRCDVYSADFDSLHCLKWNTISISHMSAPTLDNISKLYALLPGKSEVGSSSQAVVKSTSQSLIASTVAPEPLGPKNKHTFELIAEASLHVRKRGAPVEEASASPLALLHAYMQNNVRVRIVVRRDHSIRGSLDAYIRAFDKHFNMLLSDVDEEYITNSQKRRAMVKGTFRSQNNVKRRHLSQLLLRGDLVVIVFKKPS